MLILFDSTVLSCSNTHIYALLIYSKGVILWELVTRKKPYDGMSREMFYLRVVKGDERPPIHKKWPVELTKLMRTCWR